MSDMPMQTPLTDLLRDVPKDLRAEWPIQWSDDGRETGHTLSPIGKHCHDAADRIAELERQLVEAQKDAERYRWLYVNKLKYNIARHIGIRLNP